MKTQLKGALIGIAAVLFFGLAGALVAQNDVTTGLVWFTPPKTIFSGTLALNTTKVDTGTCGAAQTVAATGLLTTDAIQVTFNADPTAVTGYTGATSGGLTLVPYPTADTVNIKACNRTGADITPGSAVTLNIKVTR